MQNPIVIFVCKDRVDALKDKTFPLGLSGAGGMDAPAQTKDYAVLLLDDTAPTIPTSSHSNKDANAPLLIVVHGTSQHHKELDIPSQLPDIWGKPFVCERFSHLTENAIFKEIEELIADPKGSAESFAAKRHDKSQLEWLDHLAAICQLKMVDSAANIESLERGFLAQLGISFSNDFENAKYSDGGTNPNWKTAVAHIQAKAKIFVAST